MSWLSPERLSNRLPVDGAVWNVATVFGALAVAYVCSTFTISKLGILPPQWTAPGTLFLGGFLAWAVIWVTTMIDRRRKRHSDEAATQRAKNEGLTDKLDIEHFVSASNARTRYTASLVASIIDPFLVQLAAGQTITQLELPLVRAAMALRLICAAALMHTHDTMWGHIKATDVEKRSMDSSVQIRRDADIQIDDMVSNWWFSTSGMLAAFGALSSLASAVTDLLASAPGQTPLGDWSRQQAFPAMMCFGILASVGLVAAHYEAAALAANDFRLVYDARRRAMDLPGPPHPTPREKATRQAPSPVDILALQPLDYNSREPGKILGSLRYDDKRHQWVVELGQTLANFVHLSDAGQPLPDKPHDKEHVRHLVTRQLAMHGLDHHGVQRRLAVPDVGEHLDQLVGATVETISKLGDEGEFLRIGLAARFLELASYSSDSDRVLQYHDIARSQTETVYRVNATTLYRLLAQSPLDEKALRGKLERASLPVLILYIPTDTRMAQGTADAKQEAAPLDTEWAALQEVVGVGLEDGALAVRSLPERRLSHLHEYLDHEPIVLHFCGHGVEEGFRFQDDGGGVSGINSTAFIDLLIEHRKQIRGVVVSPHYTIEQVRLLAEATGYAIVLDERQSDPKAMTFIGRFYAKLGEGATFEQAYKQAITNARHAVEGAPPRLFRGSGWARSEETIQVQAWGK